MTRKKKLYSLLAILLSVTLLVTGIISVLILWLAQRSTSNFENFLIESRQQELSSAVQSFSSDVERLTLLMDVQTDARDALRTAQIYRQVEAIFSVGGGMSCGLMMQQYLKLGDTEKALDCLKQMVEAAVGPAMTPNPALFYPTLAPKKSANQTPRELRVMLLRGLREDEAFTDLRDTQAYREAAARLEESLQKEN